MTASTDASTTPRIEQVGGDHYASTGLQHWDLCARHDVHYLLGCASKYVARHRRKNGREDLEKAVSYLERYGRARSDGETRYYEERLVPPEEFVAWAAASRLDPRDLPVLLAIMCTCQHHVALAMLREMIELEYPVPPVWAQPGTPEDGGQHAVVLPRFLTQFEYDHRIDPEVRGHYAHNPSSCCWELQEGPGVVADDVGADG